MAGPAAPIDLARRYRGNTDFRTLPTPDRSVAVPNGDGRADEDGGCEYRHKWGFT